MAAWLIGGGLLAAEPLRWSTLSATSDKRDGEWLRVSYRGRWVADVRGVAELEQWFPIADLEPDGLRLAA
jgi:hypothetical protein